MLLPTVPLSTPKCWVEGPEEKGGPVSLRCKSSQGSAPISYTWSRESGGAMPPTATQSNPHKRLIISLGGKQPVDLCASVVQTRRAASC